ncbi:protein of unknown function [Shewanella benthica]|uniref:DUF805 domain-containing protein n=1 Tax=Shewanella benthica TaxID=43661 RepID=A0A330M9D9_9GAMM|nr:DUF805 domain-containing protein [Shewanella benthica]SQH78073.1 protein of unknown function [Shewanella benthica]
MIFSTVPALGLFIPTIAICARRLHDTGRSGWWQLIGLIPLHLSLSVMTPRGY